MKRIEYLYNVIYYFFYRSAIKFFYGIDYILWPIAKLFYSIVNRIPSIRKYYITKESNDPEKVAKVRLKKVTENKELSLGTIYGHGFATFILICIYFGFYHIFMNFAFPEYEDRFLYTLIVISVLAYATDIFLTQNPNQGAHHIRKFNKKTGWWRIKWATITALSPFFSVWFALSTTQDGDLGRYILSLNGYSKSEINQLNDRKTRSLPNSNPDMFNNLSEDQKLLKRIRSESPQRIN